MGVIKSGHNSAGFPNNFGASDAVTADALNDHVNDSKFDTTAVDDSTIELTTSDTKLQVKDDGITFAKMQNISTDKVLGRTTAGTGAVEELDLLDEDDMNSDSDTAVATQQSIKAYVDNSSADGFSPTTYTGGESVTFPNGLIMKWGSQTVSGDNQSTVTFGTAFPNACISAQATLAFDGFQNNDAGCGVFNLSTTTLTLRNGFGHSGAINWFAIGR